MPTAKKMMHAEYRALIGHRPVNALIAAAGLGVTGAYRPVTYTIDWKPGEEVDEERARKLCEVIRNGINTDPVKNMDCSSVELVRIYATEN